MSNTVPDGWSNPVLGKVFSLLRGSVIPNENPNERFDYYSLPIFDQTGSSATVLGSEIESNKTLITEQAILVSKLNPRKPRVQLVKEVAGLRRCASTEFMAYAPKSSGVSLPFYKYYFLSEYFSGRLQLVATGSTNSHVRVTPGETLRWSIPQPPLLEQQKIAAILSSVDDVIEKTRAQIDKLKDLKTGMMQELLTKGIGHTAFKDSPVGRIPEGWDVLPLDSVVERIIDCEHKTAPYVESSEYMVVRTSNVRNGQLVREDMRFTTEGGFNEWTRRAVPSVGDVLFTREAPAGESCMVPEGVKVCMGQRMVLLRPDSEKVYPSYFSLFLTSERAKLEIYELSIGTTVTRINIEDIRRILCIVPPLEEQKAIYSKIQSVQLLISAKEEQEKGQSCMKKALMQDLLTGKVRVSLDNKETAVA